VRLCCCDAQAHATPHTHHTPPHTHTLARGGATTTTTTTTTTHPPTHPPTHAHSDSHSKSLYKALQCFLIDFWGDGNHGECEVTSDAGAAAQLFNLPERR
jgi:hypothetical protein